MQQIWKLIYFLVRTIGMPLQKSKITPMVRPRGALSGARTRLLFVGQFMVVSVSVFSSMLKKGTRRKRSCHVCLRARRPYSYMFLSVVDVLSFENSLQKILNSLKDCSVSFVQVGALSRQLFPTFDAA
jgi:hypothetical protein